MSVLSTHTEQKAIEVVAKCLSYFEQLTNLTMTAADDINAKRAENCLRRIIADAKCERFEPNIAKSIPVGIKDVYVFIKQPMVQALREYEWFLDECYLLHVYDEHLKLQSGYFVPFYRIVEIDKPV